MENLITPSNEFLVALNEAKQNYVIVKGKEKLAPADKRNNLNLIAPILTLVNKEYTEPVENIEEKRLLYLFNWAINGSIEADSFILYLLDELYEESVFSYVRISDEVNTLIERFTQEELKPVRFRFDHKLIVPTQLTVRFGNRENRPRKLRLILSAYRQSGVTISDETREIEIIHAVKIERKMDWTYERWKTNSES